MMNKIQLDRIEKDLKIIKGALPKQTKTWVPASVITELTGWNNEKMRQRREQGLIKFRKENGKMEYLLESLHPLFIKPQSNEKGAPQASA